MNSQTGNELCEFCTPLVGAKRGTPPHHHLVFQRSERFQSIQGNADEAYYVCSICGHEWLHETGDCGMGWVK